MVGSAVLVVEDNQDIRETIVELLISEGYIVLAACDGLDALSKLEQGPQPTWILLDLTMPKMGGRECLSEIRKNPHWAEIPVTLLSASFRINNEAKLHNVDYLEKPFELNVLIAMATKHCK